MIQSDALHQRGQALEDEFFHRVDEKLEADLRAKMERDEARSQMLAATGFKDGPLLDHMLDAGFTTTSATALALVPVVFVAWADGNVTPAEHQKIIHEALRQGIYDRPEAFSILEQWLEKAPDQTLWKLWEEYSQAVTESLQPAAAAMLHAEVLRLATVVAEASGGHFGRGKVSAKERAVLDQISETFADD